MRTRIKGEQWFDVPEQRYKNACFAESMDYQNKSDTPKEGDRGWLISFIYERPSLYTQPK